MSDSQTDGRTAEGAAPAPLPSPGTLLRQARERAGLGAEDLAGQLKLAKGTLEALERDDFAALSEPVYVRGYYRKIAKLLPLDERELIAAYDARSKPAKAVPAMQRIPLAGGVAAGAARQPRGQGIGIAVVVLIVFVALFVLADRQSNRRAAPPAAPAATVEPAVTAPPETPASPAAEPVAGAEPAAPPAVAGVPAVPNQLVLEFSESSFVRVEDSRNRTLAIGLVRGGERQVLDGQPPYTVFLGNAQNVKVFFHGQPVDFAAHINRQNDTARFTVP